MKTLRFAVHAAAAVLLLALAGCSTPATRISHNPSAFAALPPDQQNQVRAGQVSVGMTESAVELALGHPDRVTVRTDRQGQSQTWHYVEYVYAPGPIYWGGGWGYRRSWRGGWGPGPFWGGDVVVGAYDRSQVVFRNGLVTTFSQDLR